MGGKVTTNDFALDRLAVYFSTSEEDAKQELSKTESSSKFTWNSGFTGRDVDGASISPLSETGFDNVFKRAATIVLKPTKWAEQKMQEYQETKKKEREAELARVREENDRIRIAAEKKQKEEREAQEKAHNEQLRKAKEESEAAAREARKKANEEKRQLEEKLERERLQQQREAKERER